MRKVIIFLLCLLITKSVYSQTDLVSKIVYNQSFKYGNREFKGVLLASKNETIYFYGRSDDGNEKKELIEKSELEYQINLSDKEGWSTYINKDKNLILSRDNIFTKFFIVSEVITNFNWNLHTETKKIGNYICKKATCNYRGRDYIAWFSPEIPLNSGPWKFGGLPGLIFEIYDSEELFKFSLFKLEIPSIESINSKKLIIPPTSGNTVTVNQFKEILKEKTEAVSNALKASADPESTGNTSVVITNQRMEKYD